MSVSFEKPESIAKGNWSAYVFEMGDLAEHENWEDLEALLMMDHPLLPGEREAYDELMEALKKQGRHPRVQVDPNNPKHIIPVQVTW